MIIDILSEENGFTETDKTIARFILTHEIEHMTSAELGRKAGASQSAVIRLVNKLGMNTYRQFQIELQLDKALRQQLVDHSPAKGAGEAEMASIAVFQAAVYETSETLSAAVLEDVCARLRTAQMIDCFGTGISSLYARMFVFHLQGLGLNARFIEVPLDLYLSHLDDRNRMGVIFSLFGENQTMTDAARALKEKNIYTAVITDGETAAFHHLAGGLLKLAEGICTPSSSRNTEISCLYVCHIIYNWLGTGMLPRE